MTAVVDICNRALASLGTRTTVSAAELSNESTNEAIQLNLVLNPTRRQLLRMAPWNCGTKSANLVYITSAPGTPENTSAPTPLWQPGQPAPPWAYEYQYPVDCLRPIRVIPATTTGQAGGVPITTAVTGGNANFWAGPPVKYAVRTDRFVPVTAASVAVGGTGHAVGDVITLPQSPQGTAPVGAPAQLLVTGASAGTITSVSVVNVVGNVTDSPSGGVETIGGSYFSVQPNPIAQASTTGIGTGASFNLTFGTPGPQRVILTNQEFAIMDYVQDVTDPNIMDDQFQEAWAMALAAGTCFALTGDKKLKNAIIQELNAKITLARVGDGNEGLTVNDVTPDWIAIRGADFVNPFSSPFTDFDWGSLWPMYG